MNGATFACALTDKKALPAGTFTKTLAMIFHAYSPDSKIVTLPKLNTAHTSLPKSGRRIIAPSPQFSTKNRR
jgi:hypothetical protein